MHNWDTNIYIIHMFNRTFDVDIFCCLFIVGNTTKPIVSTVWHVLWLGSGYRYWVVGCKQCCGSDSFLADPDPHPFFADPDTAVLLNADSDPAAFLMRIRILLNKMYNKLPYEEFSGVEKDKQYCSKVKKKHGADPNLLTISTNFLFPFHFFCF